MSQKKWYQKLTSSLRSSESEKPAKDLVEMGRVVSDPARCVQCGVCSYNCPLGIPVRDYARQGLAVDDPHCITCSQCINVCPRGTLRWETASHKLIEQREFLPTPDEPEQAGTGTDLMDELAAAFFADNRLPVKDQS